LVLKVL